MTFSTIERVRTTDLDSSFQQYPVCTVHRERRLKTRVRTRVRESDTTLTLATNVTPSISTLETYLISIQILELKGQAFGPTATSTISIIFLKYPETDFRNFPFRFSLKIQKNCSSF